MWSLQLGENLKLVVSLWTLCIARQRGKATFLREMKYGILERRCSKRRTHLWKRGFFLH